MCMYSMMELKFKNQKEKKFVHKDIVICISCGSENISHIDFTIYCKNCGSLNFFEVAPYG